MFSFFCGAPDTNWFYAALRFEKTSEIQRINRRDAAVSTHFICYRQRDIPNQNKLEHAHEI